MRHLEPVATVAVLLAALLACERLGESPATRPPGPSAQNPSAICAKLVAAKVARNCSAPSEGSMATTVGFDLVGVVSYKGSIMRCSSAATVK